MKPAGAAASVLNRCNLSWPMFASAKIILRAATLLVKIALPRLVDDAHAPLSHYCKIS